jgi:hypothetical protein
LLAAAALLSAFFSLDVCFAFGSQLPLLPALVPGTRLKPGQQACPLPVLFFAGDFFFAGAFLLVDFFAGDFFVVAMWVRS